MKNLLLCLMLVSTATFAVEEHPTKRKTLIAKDQKVLEVILKKNDLLFNAFLKKEKALIEKTAKNLSTIVSKSDSSLLKEVKANVKNLSSIKAANENEKNLKLYESFLNPLIKIVKEYDVAARYNIFSCPMVEKSWIQNVETNKGVKNVYDMSMLECGTQETHFKE